MTPPALIKLYRLLRLAVFGLGLLLLAEASLLVFRVLASLHRLEPIAAWIAFALALAVLGALLFYAVGRWLDLQEILPPDGPEEGARSHRDLVTANRFLAGRLKHLAANAAFTEEQQKHLRQQAYQIEEMLGHHPLHDDLLRSWERTRAETLEPAHAVLRARAEASVRERMGRVVKDLVEPPFPSHALITVYGHQLVMATRIVDLYVPNAGLLVYFRILRDVALVMIEGRFARLGQAMLAGVHSNSPPLGGVATTLGQSLSAAWLTRTVSRACIQRCELTQAWSPERAVQAMDGHMVAMLGECKECLMQDVLPVLKQAIRHNAPPGITDATGFTASVIEGLVRALDAAVRTHQAQPAAAVAAARRTLTGETDPLPPPEHRDRHRRRRRSSSGVLRVLHVFAQRIKYTMRSPR